MAVTITNRGLFLLASTDIEAADLRMAVLTGTVPAVGTVRDFNFLSDVLASTLDEATASGYSRMTLTGVTLTEDDTGNGVTLVADAPTQSTVAAGETFVAVAYYVEGGSDAARAVFAIDEPAAPLITNGSDVTYPALDITITNP